MIRRNVWMTGGVLVSVAGSTWLARSAHDGAPAIGESAASLRSAEATTEPPPHEGARSTLPPDDPRSHAFRVPTGEVSALSCEAARAIVMQVRQQLANPPEPIDPKAFGEVSADWLDPFGLWSVAPDAPMGAAFDKRSGDLLAEVEGRGGRDCVAARAIGAELVTWVGELRATFDEARSHAGPGEDALAAASSGAFEGATVTRPARSLAATLGRRIAAFERDLGPAARPYVDAARARYFPPLDADGWAHVVLAAAVRAYVPTIDPHGAWAPLDEESSVYEVDLEARPPSRLWDKAARTAVGVRIDSGATPPLADGDVVLSLAGVATAGMSFEQVEQIAFAASDVRPPAQAVVLRPGEKLPVTTWLDGAPAEAKSSAPPSEGGDDLPVERVAYGEGDAVVVTVRDVRDDLGDALTRALLRERGREGRAVAGVVLDLRGNGGGSTDGAIDALGLFIPGASLFPMKRRDGSLETDRAPEPPSVDRWRGPVASLVDSDTASAAEMIAGAISAYRRGPSIGATTFGKGCAQEYLEDDARAGVLRLTTLLYALPDGTPVQRVGLTPTLRIAFGETTAAAAAATDREATLLHSAPAWRGPDVRDRGVLAHVDDGAWNVAWPAHGGNVGPCKDADVCRAMRLLGTGATARRATPTTKGR